MTYTENDHQRLSLAIREVCDVVEGTLDTSIGGSIGKVVCEVLDTLQHLRNFKLYLKNHEVNNV